MQLLDTHDIRCSFHMRGSVLRAVDGVSFSLGSGETLGIVGESGSGKTVLSLSLLKLIAQPPGKVSGEALFDGTDLLKCSIKEIRAIRGNRISMIFQDPSTSLNPYLRISEQLIEPLLIHRGMSRRDALKRAEQALGEAGIQNASHRMLCYPHEFSGGMRQRVMIAMSLISEPQIVIADEPTTALDVTVQAQILSLMKKLQNHYGMSIIFITHNLGIVARFCDRVLVMYAGRILESARTRDLFKHTAHPYTRALIRSIPSFESNIQSLYVIPGTPPDLCAPNEGCPFAARCEFSAEICRTECRELCDCGPDHTTSCKRFLKGEIRL